MFKVGDFVSIKVKNNVKDLYLPEFLHNQAGKVFDINNTHIDIKTIIQDINSKEFYISGPHRYIIDDVDIKKLSF